MTNRWGPGCNCCNEPPNCVNCNMTQVTVAGVSGPCSECGSNYNGTFLLNLPTTLCKFTEHNVNFTCLDVSVSFFSVYISRVRCSVRIQGGLYVAAGSISGYYSDTGGSGKASYHVEFWEKKANNCSDLIGAITKAGSSDTVVGVPALGSYGDYCGTSGATFTISL